MKDLTRFIKDKMGRGRPSMRKVNRKVPYSTRLDPKIVAWLRKQTVPASRLIEKALNDFYKINILKK